MPLASQEFRKCTNLNCEIYETQINLINLTFLRCSHCRFSSYSFSLPVLPTSPPPPSPPPPLPLLSFFFSLPLSSSSLLLLLLSLSALPVPPRFLSEHLLPLVSFFLVPGSRDFLSGGINLKF